ncbi:MAG: DNA alkylation repair protein [Caldilineales bacterium]
MLDINAERERFLERFRELADPDYQAGQMMVMKTQLHLYGVRVPELRRLSGDWQRAHKGIAPDELLAMVEALWTGASYEERAMAIELLGRNKRVIPGLSWDHFDRWRHQVDNWGLDDALATTVFGPWLAADLPGRLAHLRALVVDPVVWSRRLGLVATVPLNRDRSTGQPDLTLALVDQLKGERQPMITKAISWALRTMITFYPDQVAAYLDANADTLPSHAIREVRNKLQTGLKSGKPT